MIIDEETPESSLDYHLARFSKGLGFNYSELPIYRYSMKGFRFGRKTEMDKILKLVSHIDPIFIRMDSLLAMLPGGRQFQSENDSRLGEMIRDDLNQLLNPECSILIAAHSKKYIAELSLEEVSGMEMQGIVRGHGSIVGEGCDTGYIIKKVSTHPNPTRFCVITKARRQAIPDDQPHLIELKEEYYGLGWARLELIPLDSLPPSDLARIVYHTFNLGTARGGSLEHSSKWILQTCAFQTKRECKIGVQELMKHKVIVETKPQSYVLNPKRFSECNPGYMQELI